MRSQFEKWYYASDAQYIEGTYEACWIAWQAACRQTLEDAAKECLDSDNISMFTEYETREACATAIRALKEKIDE